MMKNWVSGGLLTAVITLPALSGTVWAQDNDKCSNATLKGDYAFSVVDFTTQSVVVGLGKFDGKGGFTQIDYPGDRLRTTGTLDFRMGQSGSYTVNPDCTGTQEIDLNVPGVPVGTSHGVIDNVFVVSDGGRSVHGVVAQVTPPGATKPTPVQTRFDMWRVGSERDD
jgi:hypothetical protein